MLTTNIIIAKTRFAVVTTPQQGTCILYVNHADLSIISEINSVMEPKARLQIYLHIKYLHFTV